MTEKALTVFKRHAVPINYSEPERRGSYEELLLKLKAVQELPDAADNNDLHEAIEALSVVIAFLTANHDVHQNRLALPLEKLFLALCDVLNGGKPAMLDVRKAGKPRRDTEAVKRAELIIMLEMLRDARVEKPAAWLAANLKAAGVEDTSEEKGERKEDRIKGKTITPAKLERWRSEIYGKSLKGTDEAYECLLRRDKKWGKRLSPGHAKFIVRNRIWSLLEKGF